MRVQAINFFNHTSTDKVWISLFFVYFELIDMNSFVISADWITDWKTMTFTLALDRLTVFVTFCYFSKLPKLVWRSIRASRGTVALLRNALRISKRIQRRSTCSCLCFQRHVSRLGVRVPLPPILVVKLNLDTEIFGFHSLQIIWLRNIVKKFSNLPNVLCCQIVYCCLIPQNMQIRPHMLFFTLVIQSIFYFKTQSIERDFPDSHVFCLLALG